MTDAPPNEPTDPDPDAITKALRTVFDPEIPVNVHDLGLIYALDVGDDGGVRVRMTLTAPGCPMADVIVRQVREAVAGVPGVTAVDVDLVWDPPWSPDRMSEAARLELEFTGHTGPAHLRRDRTSSLTIGGRKTPRKRD
jgi:FeS assembly SUF system protein